MKGINLKYNLFFIVTLSLIINVNFVLSQEKNNIEETNKSESIKNVFNGLIFEATENDIEVLLDEILEGKDSNTEKYLSFIFNIFFKIQSVRMKVQLIEFLMPKNERNNTKELMFRVLDALDYLQKNYVTYCLTNSTEISNRDKCIVNKVIESLELIIRKFAIQYLLETFNFDSLFYKELFNKQPLIADIITQQTILIAYTYKSIDELVTEIIYKLPTIEEKVMKLQYILNIIKSHNEVFNSDKIFEYAAQYKKFVHHFFKELANSTIQINIKIPNCAKNVVLLSRNLCFDNGKYTFSVYLSVYLSERYFLYPGTCSSNTYKTEPQCFWNKISEKNSNLRDLESLDRKIILKNVKFELAPPNGEHCYVKIGNRYLSQSGDTQYLVLESDKTSASIWNISHS